MLYYKSFPVIGDFCPKPIGQFYYYTFWPFFWVSFDHQQKNDDHDGDDLFLRPLLSSCYVCVWPLKNSC